MKIDMQFLSNFEGNKKAGMILNSIVRLAEQVDMKTLTEGVETKAQADFLESIGCERLQGYLFGKPMSRPDLVTALKENALPISEEFLN
ncbi:MAG: EAL domain-containing protein [Lachnospiraceae bacterium]|nr:EAL domain-containing protein [Lachnospiraceae bacterium]